MKTKVQKWGNSLAVRLPKWIAEQKQLKEESVVQIVLIDNQIIVEPLVEEDRLEDLLKKISKDSLHDEVDWSSPHGKEIW